MNPITRKVVVVTPPALEPVTLAEARLWCKVEETDDDGLIEDILIPAAREMVEDLTDLSLQTQTLKLLLDSWPDGAGPIVLPRATPLQSVSSIKYYDSAGVEYTWAAANYIVDTLSRPGRVVRAYGVSYPSFTMYPSNPIQIQYVAGTPDSSPAVPVPAKLKLAMRYLIEHWYDNRNIVAVGTLTREMELTLRALLANSTIYSF